MFGGVGLIDKYSAGPECRCDLRKQTAFEIEENYDEVKRVFWKLGFGKVDLFGEDVDILLLGLPPRLLESHLRDVHEGDEPAAFGEVESVATDASGQIEGASYIFEPGLDKLAIGAQEKWIGLAGCMRSLFVALVPFSVRVFFHSGGLRLLEQTWVMRVAGIDSDLQIFLAAGVPAGLLPILREHAVRAFEGLLASVTEFKLAAFELDRVVDVVGDAAEGVPVGGHAIAQPQEI